MVGILEFLSGPAAVTSKAVKASPYSPHWIAGVTFKLHCITGSALFLASCLIVIKEVLGDHIHCIQDTNDEGGRISDEAFNSYCYISSTFTLPPQEMISSSAVLTNKNKVQIYPGVGPSSGARNADRDASYHNYYQWTGYLLFAQSLSFFGPAALHRFVQDGRVQRVLLGLHNVYVFSETRDDKYGDIDIYFRDWFNHQDWWAAKLIATDALNLVNIIVNIFFVNWYLGGTFLTYGPTALGYIFESPDTRGDDPFDLVFPKMTKCTLRSFGPSGSVQTRDALCVMTVNILNEKVFFLLWFLLITLCAFTIAHHVCAFVVICSADLRRRYLTLFVSPERVQTRWKLARILAMTRIGDWLMLYKFATNTDRVVFSQLLDYIHYPDYNRHLEPTDPENRELLRRTRSEMDRSIYGGRNWKKVKRQTSLEEAV